MDEVRTGSGPIDAAAALRTLNAAVVVSATTCPVCGTPLGWWGAELVATHARYQQAQAVVAAAVLTWPGGSRWPSIGPFGERPADELEQVMRRDGLRVDPDPQETRARWLRAVLVEADVELGASSEAGSAVPERATRPRARRSE